MKKIISLIIVGVLLSACSGGRSINIISNKDYKNPKSTIPSSYIVRRGDNLYGISSKYKISISELVKINDLKQPYYLAEGSKLKMPVIKKYRINRGDTMYSLSRKFNVSVTDIARLNKLPKTITLQRGNYINIPKTTKQLNEIKAIKKPVSKYQTASQKIKQKKKKVKLKENAKVKIKQNKRLVRKSVKYTPKSKGRFIFPTKGKIISNFGKKSTGVFNDGINISAKKGSAVKAVDNGVIAYAGSGLKGYGNMVLIKHDNKIVTVYGHMNSISVKKGDIIKQGQRIGGVGSTGRVKTPQLHFQIRKRRQILNPNKYLH